ncbi:MAG TPA: extracellular solute-binding protein, partial [Acetobacteraceae bacterium]|nr:extracellular solute-binding protein [Acetobacteraceae bacterium]
MSSRSWRHIAASLCLLGAGWLAQPSPAQAAGKKLVVWWNQGFYPAEDQAMRKTVAAWEKKTGNKVELTFYNGSDLPTKIISAMTTGDVPDICYVDNGDFLITPQAAWKNKLVDVSSVVHTVSKYYSKTALISVHLYDNVTHTRSYFAVPIKQQALHNSVWRPLIEKAGYHVKDIPKTWNAYWKFFETVQTKLRAKGMRIYGLGFSMATKDSDSTYLINQMILAYGGDLVSPDGKLMVGDPKVRAAAIKAITLMTDAYKKGFVPPSAINWGDPDNNAAFYAKQIVMTPNASLSIPVAMKDKPQLYYHDIVTQAQPLGPDGKPVRSLVAVKSAFIPKGAKNVALAKAFLTYLVQPKNLDAYLKAAQGRWLPVMPSIVKNDPFWTNPKDPHLPVAVKQEVTGPTTPWFQE